MTKEEFDKAQKFYSEIDSINSQMDNIKEIERCFDDKDYDWKYLSFNYNHHCYFSDSDVPEKEFRVISPTVDEAKQLISFYKELLKKRKLKIESEIREI